MTISPVLCARECRQNIVKQFDHNELNQLARSAPVARISTKVYNHNNRISSRTDKLTAYEINNVWILIEFSARYLYDSKGMFA